MARDAAVVAQTLHLDGSETLTSSAEAPLAVEDAGDLLVGVVNGQAAQQVDGVLIGLDRGLGSVGGVDVELRDCTSLPADDQVAAGLVLARLITTSSTSSRISSLRSRSVAVGASQTSSRSRPEYKRWVPVGHNCPRQALMIEVRGKGWDAG